MSRARPHNVPHVGRSAQAVLLLLGSALWTYSLFSFDSAKIGSYGLVQAMSWTYVAALPIFVCVALLQIADRTPSSKRLLHASTALLFIAVFVTPSLVEGTPRFSFVFNAFGHADYISRYGHLNLEYTYQYWPALHLLNAVLLQFVAVGRDTVLLWAPVGLQLGGLVAVFLLAREVSGSRRFAWLAVVIAMVAKTGAAYAVPGGLASVLYGMIAWITFRAVREREAVSLKVTLILLLTALVSTHFLTTLVAIVLLTFASTSLNPRRRFLGVGVTILGVVLTISWQLYVAESWTVTTMVSTLRSLLDSAGIVEDVYQLGFGGEAARTQVVLARIAYAGTVVTLAGLGFVTCVVRRGWRHAAFPTMGVAAAVLSVAFGSYQGEVVSRMYGFALPFLPILAACLFATRWGSRLLGSTLFALSMIQPLVMFGNERIDYIFPSEISATALFEDRRPSDFALSVAPQRVWGALFIENQYSQQEAPHRFVADGPVFEQHRAFVGAFGETKGDITSSSTVYANGTSNLHVEGGP